MATSPLVNIARRRATAATAVVKASRGLHSTSRSQASILFALQALSNSRETQHFNKISRLNRVEHSPSLKLIETSEVNPYVPAKQLTSQEIEPAVRIERASKVEKTGEAQKVESRRHRDAHSIPSSRALALGQSVLHSHARSIRRSEAALSRTRDRLLRRSQIALESEAAWSVERNKYKAELRSAGALIVVAIGIATAAVTWRLGVEKAGARASNIVKSQPTTSTSAATPTVAGRPPIAPPMAVPAVPQLTMKELAMKSDVEKGAAIRTWRSLLWKRD